jgi:pyrophosphatase PpaX
MAFKYSTILFDFDGTLTPSLHLWVRAYQYAFGKLGVNLSAEDIISNCFYVPWADLVSRYELPSVDAFRDHVHDGLDQAFVDARLFDGAMEFLEECMTHNVTLGIVTSSVRVIVDRFLRSHNLNRYFGTVVTADDITNHKPHPEPVLLALSHLKIEAHRGLFIGDSEYDLRAARAAGMESALFFPHEHHVYYDFHSLMGHEPGFVFHNYSELKDRCLAVKSSTQKA